MSQALNQVSSIESKTSTSANNTALSVLKQMMEVAESNITHAREAHRSAQNAESDARFTLNRLNKAYESMVTNYLMICKVEGIELSQDELHELGQDCEQDGCKDCCGEFAGHEYDSSEGGYCLNCNDHPND